MITIDIAIISDNDIFIEEISNMCGVYLSKHLYSANIIKILSTNETQKKMSLSPEIKHGIIFLDVIEPDCSVLKTAMKIRMFDKLVCICFIACDTQCSLKAYSVHAFDYMIKPVKQDNIDKFFIEYFEYFTKENESCTFDTIEGIVNVDINDIIYFEYLDKSHDYRNRVVVIHLKNGVSHVLDDKIKNIYSKLDNRIFKVPHRSFIISINNIKHINQDKVIMCNDVEIPLSQKRKKEIKESFKTITK